MKVRKVNFFVYSTLYAKKLKRVDEWHVGKTVYNRVRYELSQKNI